MMLALLLLLQDAFDVGRETWQKPWVSDLKGGRAEIPAEKQVEVVILGDGYLDSERADFEKAAKAWHDKLLTITPWKEFGAAFRVRAVWTASAARATTDRKSHYRIPVGPDGVGDVSSKETREAILAATAKAGAKQPFVAMLRRDDRKRNPSGKTRRLGDVPVAFGAYTMHEFGHAYGGLADEYIEGEGRKTERKAPDKISMFSVSNLSYSKSKVPWAHLAPGSAANPDRSSVIGLCWIGGGAEEGVWHSEPKCLMNGTHDNWNFEKTRRGVNLRDQERFCFWCEEIVVAKTLWRTGRLGDSKDGVELWKRWEEARPQYQKSFDVPGRIRARNGENATAKLGDAKIYEKSSE
jgi:hypothetical protein